MNTYRTDIRCTAAFTIFVENNMMNEIEVVDDVYLIYVL